MAKNIIIRKHVDKIEIRNEEGDLIVDIIVAGSSRTTSVNLSLKATNRTTLIMKVPQTDNRRVKIHLHQKKNPWAGFGSFLANPKKPAPKTKKHYDDKSSR